ncbi:hypothetical protein KSP40_PGU000290 [Platanthera guangdongensis]|uniref:Uncharacterized protein n=1 Tax=Platanthera guangdongensis TaxID=2320717 RepID=A0ABR2MES2_9ASPA
MGGGNAQKSKMAREKNNEKMKGQKGSQLETNKAAMSIQVLLTSGTKSLGANRGVHGFNMADDGTRIGRTRCKVCMQTFMCTTSESKCREHAEAKHPKVHISQCFPHLK